MKHLHLFLLVIFIAVLVLSSCAQTAVPPITPKSAPTTPSTVPVAESPEEKRLSLAEITWAKIIP